VSVKLFWVHFKTDSIWKSKWVNISCQNPEFLLWNEGMCERTAMLDYNWRFQCELVIFFFFLRYWGLNSGPIPWATPPFFCDGVLR
jgi:hypothetical protein